MEITRTYLISDTHGFYEVWRQFFLSEGLIDPEGNWLDPTVRLIHVGDHTDRGEDSPGLYRLVKSFPKVVRLMGNHDLHYVDGPPCGIEKYIMDNLSEEIRQDVLDGSIKFAHVFEADKPWLCVHAGLVPAWKEIHAMDIYEAADLINEAGRAYVAGEESDYNELIEGIGPSRGGWPHHTPGVTWADYYMDLRPAEQHITHPQIVGHSVQPYGANLSPRGKVWAINVPYGHTQALVYDHKTNKWGHTAHTASMDSPFAKHADEVYGIGA